MRQLLADGILAREESLREGLIDDRDLGLRLVVGFLERRPRSRLAPSVLK
jgi:hypothetical protein